MISPRRCIRVIAFVTCLFVLTCMSSNLKAEQSATEISPHNMSAGSGYPDPASAGISDVVLLAEMNKNDLLSLVAYVDTAGVPQDWFYDGFIPLRITGDYVNGITDKTQWEDWLNALFTSELPRLHKALRTAEKTLGARPSPLKIIVFIPYPSPEQKNFGDVDGDGKTEDLSSFGDRRKVMDWYINEVKTVFRKLDYKGMDLWGFYWNGEGIYNDEDEVSIRTASDSIHAAGLKLLWIPYFGARGIENWRDLGFDVVTQQPGYAWLAPIHRGTADEERLSVASARCRQYGMGVELEVHGTSAERQRNIQRYLDHGVDELEGYQDTIITVNDSGYIQEAGKGTIPGMRRVYDDLYRFAKGTYKRRDFNQPLKTPKSSVSKAADVRKLGALVDGIWNTRSGQGAPSVDISEKKTTLTFDLGAGRIVGDVRVHFTNPDGHAVSPQRIVLAVSRTASGENFREVASVCPAPLLKDTGGGFGVLTCPSVLVRRMRVVLNIAPGQKASVDEVLLMPAEQPLLGEPCDASGSTGDSAGLTDGMVGGGDVTTWQGQGKVTIRLPETRYVGSIAVHFRRVKQEAFAPQLKIESVDSVSRVQVSGDECWVVVPHNQLMKDLTVTLSDSKAGVVSVDEIAAVDSESPSVGKAYTIDPAFFSDFPDTDRKKLTNGELSTGISDKKNLRWFVGFVDWPLRPFCSPQVTVILDLGRVQKIDEVAAHLWGGGKKLAAHEQEGVNFPRSIMVSVSKDGIEWTSYKRFENAIELIGDGDIEKQDWLRQSVGAQGRFVKLRFSPDGFYLVLSEIQVISKGKNIALAKPYTLLPQPTGFSYLVDNYGKLTNSYLTSAQAVSAWDCIADFVQFAKGTNPVITLDLCGIYSIRGARAHFVGWPGPSHNFPKSVAVSISTDGVKWTRMGETEDHPTGADFYVVGFMDVLFAPCQARYVRYELTSGESTMWLDEVEVVRN